MGRCENWEEYMKITTHKELDVYKLSFRCAMEIFQYTRKFPREEMFSLSDQITRASRSVSANIAEAFRSRKYEKSFISKLVISQCEAAETQTWLDFALECKYLKSDEHAVLYDKYEHIIAMIVNMIKTSKKWCFGSKDAKMRS